MPLGVAVVRAALQRHGGTRRCSTRDFAARLTASRGGSNHGRSAELGERLRVSRERLASSPLANHGQAWRLWAACADATLGYAREADQIYLSTLARTAGVHRTKAARYCAGSTSSKCSLDGRTAWEPWHQ
jgi:hypothetical protein